MDVVLMILLGALVTVVLLVGAVVYLYFFRLWFRTHIAQCSVPLGTLFGMAFRRASPLVIINAYILAHKSGISLALEDLEAHYKSKGDVKGVVSRLVEAPSDDPAATFVALCHQDLAK